MAKRRSGVYRRGRIYWIAYYRNGKLVRESSRSTKIEDANALIDKRRRETGPVPGKRRVARSTASLPAFGVCSTWAGAQNWWSAFLTSTC